MAFKMKGYGGFHGKKKPTSYKNIELEQMASGTSEYADTPISDYGKISRERLPMSGGEYSHETEGTSPSGGGYDYFDNEFTTVDGWKGNYPQGDQFTPRQDTASSRGGGTFNLKQEDINQIKLMKPENLSSKDKAIREQLLKATQGGRSNTDFQIELRPNEFQGVRAKDGGKEYSNRWASGQAYIGKEGKEGFSDLSQIGKYKNADITNFLLNIPSGEFVMKEPFDLQNARLRDEGSGTTIPSRKPGPIETKRLPDPKPPKKEQKTGEIPWDDAPKVGTEARKKFYNKYNLRYDDTIKGFNRDGSPKSGGKSKTGSDSGGTKFEPTVQGLKTGKKGGKRKNLIDKISSKASHIDLSNWDQPIRDFFQDLASPK
jgi:hypothetical protein